MQIKMDRDALAALRAKLDAFEDAEATEESEYVVDFYDSDPPFSLELAFEDDGVRVLAAETLAFDETLSGWYLSGPLSDPLPIRLGLESL